MTWTLLSSGGHKTSPISSYHWFRSWIGAVRQQAITWANVDPDLCHHMATLDHKKLSWYVCFRYPSWDKKKKYLDIRRSHCYLAMAAATTIIYWVFIIFQLTLLVHHSQAKVTGRVWNPNIYRYVRDDSFYYNGITSPAIGNWPAMLFMNHSYITVGTVVHEYSNKTPL